MEIVPRSGWAHRPARSTPVRIPDRLPRRWLHHGAAGTSSIATARAYLNHHLDGNGWDDIGYSWLIAEGQVLEGRGVGRQGAHTQGDNSSSYGVVICGNYQTRRPSDRDLEALAWLLAHGHRQGWFPAPELTGGHRDAPGASTTCPGNVLYRMIPQINATVEEDDMTPEQDRMLRNIHSVIGIDTIELGGRDVEVLRHTQSNLSHYLRRELPAHIARLVPGETVDVDEIVDTIRDTLGDDLASEVVAAMGRKLSG